ncbi:MAG: GrpB family protein, partial [Candidatus Binatia bacterium]
YRGANDEAPIRIAPYDPAWPALFQAERELLADLLRRWLVGPIEHVGSTAVPGLAAKPVIDVMAAVESLDASRGAFGVLRDAGYHYAPYRTDVMHWFCKPSPSFRTHHLHLVPYESLLWTERIAFRDCLRSDSAIAHEYADLKHRLADAHRFDREAYTQAKGSFIGGLLPRLLRDTRN